MGQEGQQRGGSLRGLTKGSWLTRPQEGAAPDLSSREDIRGHRIPRRSLSDPEGQEMDPGNGNTGNVARLSREVELESIVSPSTWGLSTGQNKCPAYRTRWVSKPRDVEPFCVASTDLRCQLLDTPSSVGAGAGAEVAAGARALSRRVHRTPVRTGTVCRDTSLFTRRCSGLLGFGCPTEILSKI